MRSPLAVGSGRPLALVQAVDFGPIRVPLVGVEVLGGYPWPFQSSVLCVAIGSLQGLASCGRVT